MIDTAFTHAMARAKLRASGIATQLDDPCVSDAMFHGRYHARDLAIRPMASTNSSKRTPKSRINAESAFKQGSFDESGKIQAFGNPITISGKWRRHNQDWPGARHLP